MRKVLVWSIVAASVAATAAGSALVVSLNQPPTNLSAQSIRLFENGEYQDSSHQFAWTSNAIAANSKTDINNTLSCPMVSTEVFTFLSLRGQESVPDGGWQAFTQTAFKGNSHDVLTPNLKPAGFINGTPGAKYSRDHGGDFSLGIACTHNGGKVVDAVSYRFINVVAHTGEWTALPEPEIKTSKQ